MERKKEGRNGKEGEKGKTNGDGKRKGIESGIRVHELLAFAKIQIENVEILQNYLI